MDILLSSVNSYLLQVLGCILFLTQLEAILGIFKEFSNCFCLGIECRVKHIIRLCHSLHPNPQGILAILVIWIPADEAKLLLEQISELLLVGCFFVRKQTHLMPTVKELKVIINN